MYYGWVIILFDKSISSDIAKRFVLGMMDGRSIGVISLGGELTMITDHSLVYAADASRAIILLLKRQQHHKSQATHRCGSDGRYCMQHMQYLSSKPLRSF